MPVLFLDTSALAKRYVTEIGSAWLTALTDLASGNRCYLAAITRVELAAALSARVRAGTLTPVQARQAQLLFRHELATLFRLIPIVPAVLDEAEQLVETYPLRAYDAVQLAAALTLQARRQALGWPLAHWVSADQALNRAAAAESFAVDDPNQHP